MSEFKTYEYIWFDGYQPEANLGRKVKATVEVVKSDSPIETISEISASYDLLILGTPEKDNWIKVLFGGGKDKFTERAACSVLRITLKD